jgi:ABC-type bacteriocin/lantibiotic exporter with double-glycine peptidase domain
MSDQVRLVDMEGVMEDTLGAGGTVTFTITGTSMRPLLISGRDQAILERRTDQYRRGDIAFYKRTDGTFVLHRIVKFKGGEYTMCGDAQVALETDILPSQIIARATGFIRKGKSVSTGRLSYQLYSQLWIIARPYRGYIFALVGRIKKVFSLHGSKPKKHSSNRKGGNTTSLLWVANRTGKLWWPIAFISVVSSAVSLSYVGFALISKQVLDIATGATSGNIWISGGMLLGLLAFQVILNILSSNLNVRFTGRLDISLKNYLLRTILSRKYHTIVNYHSGDLLNRLVSDVSVIVNGVVTSIPSTISLFVRLIAAVGVMVLISPIFALILICAGVLLFIVRRFFGPIMKRLHKTCQESDGKIRSYFAEVLENLMAVKAFNADDTIKARSKILQNDFLRLKIKRNFFSNMANMVTYIMFSASYYVALLWGAFAISAGSITFGTLTAFLQLINQVQLPIRSMSGFSSVYYSVLASAERLMEIEDLPEEGKVLDNKEFCDFSKLVIDNIAFSYDSLTENTSVRKVVNDFSLSVNRGDFIGIRGSSGAGKTTLFKLLLGLYGQDSGTMVLETKTDGGTDSSFPVNSETRSAFAFVPQGHFIFSGTLRENIAFAAPDISVDELASVLKTSVLSDLVNELDNGIDTVIGERGIGLSEGQLQRVVIARAIASGAPILLLDECTSALDETTEDILMDNLKKLSRTCIIVSHKKTTLSHCDRIISLDTNLNEKYDSFDITDSETTDNE